MAPSLPRPLGGQARRGPDALHIHEKSGVAHASQNDGRSTEAIEAFAMTIGTQLQQVVGQLHAATDSSRPTRLDTPALIAPVQGSAATHSVPRTDESLALLRRIAQSTEVATAARPTLVQMIGVSLVAGLLGGGIIAALLRLL